MSSSAKRKLFIRTWGCQMNTYDSAKMAEVLAPLGYERTEAADEADLVILNTCHIREKATEKVFSELGRLKALKVAGAAAGRTVLLAVAGCVAQAEGAEIQARQPAVDLVFGPQTYHRLPEMVAQAAGGVRLVATDFPVEAKFDELPRGAAGQGVVAHLAVQEGCDRFCSFCVVPYTRGAEYSRPAAQILAEARALAAAGSREIQLVGQNVNAYHGEGPDGSTWTLARLIAAVAEIPGIARLRYTTSHPRDMTDELIAAHGAVPALMPFLHLPVQSGSDRILAAMNRRHDVGLYRDLVARLRLARPDLALSSDFIVGFPGESDADFAATLALVREIGFAQAYSFMYSRRPGTPAAALPRQVPETVKRARLAALQAEIEAGQTAFNRSFAGRTIPVLVEGGGRRPGQIHGRSPWHHAVHAEGPARLVGQLVEMRVEAGYARGLAARVATCEDGVAA